MKPWRILTFVVIMGTASATLLVAVNSFTQPLILRNVEIKLKSSVLSVLEIPYDEDNIFTVFDERVKLKRIGAHIFYTSGDGSVAFEFRGPGLWGPISGIISLEKDFATIRRLSITHQEETPGLGGRIAEDNYLRQFKNKKILPQLIFVPEGRSSKDNEVDAITGATGSSRAFEKLLNESIKEYTALLKDIS